MKKNRFFIAFLIICLMLTVSVNAAELITVSLTTESPENHAPIAQKLELITFRGVSVKGDFAAEDPEGDDLSFRIVKEPSKGTVSVFGTSFVYTPYEGKKGKDSFSYAAVDSAGNVSEPAEVKIKIEKQHVKVSYTDMEGNGAGYAALRLAEENIYTGEKIGASYYFNPNDDITRGEFLSMCMSAAGIEPLSGIENTGFSDDELIPIWEKPFISAALYSGMIGGYADESGKLVFSPDKAISRAEAAVMLNNSLKLSDVKASLYFEDAYIPVWAAQAAANLGACGIASISSENCSASLTRGEAAQMLVSSIDIVKERGKKSLLSFSW